MSDKARKILGWVLIIGGVAAILSVFIVPALIRDANDKDIEDIRAGKYAEVTHEAVTAPAIVETTPEAATAQVVEPSERDVKMAKALEENARIGIIEIEKIDVLYAIVEGTEDAQINRAVGHLSESVGIGEKGNCVLAGHRGGYYGTFFERVPDLEKGDIIKLTDLNGVEYEYIVYDQKMVEPADWSVIRPLSDLHTLTLITCEDDTRKRIIVSAALNQ